MIELARRPESLRKERVFSNLTSDELYFHAISNREGEIATTGALVVDTRPDTGRSPKDKFVVDEKFSRDVAFGKVNQPLMQETYWKIKSAAVDHLSEQAEKYHQDLLIGAESQYQYRVRLTTPKAWTAHFARNLFRVPEGDPDDIKREWDRERDFTILHTPDLHLPGIEGLNSDRAIVTNFGERINIIAGTKYAGEVKKSMFSVMNLYLPLQDVAAMHCSANMDEDGNTALFFGLSGTGKTTISSDPERTLIGDDEHGWSDNGIFNFEGGCYAKAINLSREAEPDIYAAINRRGTILENVELDEHGNPIFEGGVENKRAAYPLDFIRNSSEDGLGNHPKHIIFLTADASGVMPAVALLSPEQAAYHYLAGYTSKIPGTERGVEKAEATFSACFGEPFLTLDPVIYQEVLSKKIREHMPTIWFVNTGWPGGYDRGGQRISIAHTRQIVRSILNNELDGIPYQEDRLGFSVPSHVPNVPQEVLMAENMWDDKKAYGDAAKELAGKFATNSEKFAGRVRRAVLASGPGFR